MSEVITFPCIFPIKVMGANQEGFESLVIEIIQRHAPSTSEKDITSRLSRNGRFLSITVLIHAMSQAQLDAIYGELSTHERVLMML